MQRRTAVAAASAISVSLVSAVIAVAANFGALGFAGTAGSPAPQPTSVQVANPAAQPTPSSPSAHVGERQGGEEVTGEREHSRPAPTPNPRTVSTGGHEHDD